MLCYVIWRSWWSFSSKCLYRLPVYYADAVWIIVRECLSVWKSIHFSLENGGLICLYLVFYWIQTLSIPYGPLKSSQTIFFCPNILCTLVSLEKNFHFDCICLVNIWSKLEPETVFSIRMFNTRSHLLSSIYYHDN